MTADQEGGHLVRDSVPEKTPGGLALLAAGHF